jgi:hypothetical protein
MKTELFSVAVSHQSQAFIILILLFFQRLIFMTQQSMQQPKELKLLDQLIGEWVVGVAMKTAIARLFLATAK